jgi:hypothetical protein
MTEKINYTFNFNQKQCIGSLKRIGFGDSSKRRGRHFKFAPPANIMVKILPGKPSFIIVPKHKELKVQRLIIQELYEMGGEELVKLFIENL